MPRPSHRRSASSPEVLYEDNHLLAVNKPAGLPTMGVAEGEPSLLASCKDYVKRAYNKPGNVYLGVVSRLDAPVTGVVLMARTSKAAARLSESFRNRAAEKTYYAIVEGVPEEPEAVLEHYLRKDERHRRVHVTTAQAEGAQLARLSYEVTAESGGLALLRVALETGRKHQIRVQLAKAGHPIVGDRKYGSSRKFEPGIGLHSRRLRLSHPVRAEQCEFVAPLPRSWSGSGSLRVLAEAVEAG